MHIDGRFSESTLNANSVTLSCMKRVACLAFDIESEFHQRHRRFGRTSRVVRVRARSSKTVSLMYSAFSLSLIPNLRERTRRAYGTKRVQSSGVGLRLNSWKGRGTCLKKTAFYKLQRSTHEQFHPILASQGNEELQQVIDVVHFAPNIVQSGFTPAPTDESI